MSYFTRLRNAKEYTDIENFKESELTECIVFEFAVRAAKDTLIELIELKTQKGNPLERRKSIRELEKKLKEEYWLKPMYFYNLDNTLDILTSDSLKKSVRKRKDYHTHTRSLLYAYHYHFLKEVMPKEYRLDLNIKGDENSLPSLIGFGSNNKDSTADYVLNSSTDTIEKSDRTLTKKKSRPSLLIPKEHSNELLVKINPNLPLKENMAFLKTALETIYARKSSLSMNELIKSMPENDEDKSVETIEHNKRGYSEKTLADMFYLYDYVTFKMETSSSTHGAILKEEEEFLKGELSIKTSSWSKYYTSFKNIISEQKYKNYL